MKFLLLCLKTLLLYLLYLRNNCLFNLSFQILNLFHIFLVRFFWYFMLPWFLMWIFCHFLVWFWRFVSLISRRSLLCLTSIFWSTSRLIFFVCSGFSYWSFTLLIFTNTYLSYWNLLLLNKHCLLFNCRNLLGFV